MIWNTEVINTELRTHEKIVFVKWKPKLMFPDFILFYCVLNYKLKNKIKDVNI